jgi:CHAT domain-containing protein
MSQFYRSITIVLVALFCALSVHAQDADLVFDTAESLYGDSKYEEAGTNYWQAAELYLQEGDSVSWARSMQKYGDALITGGNVQDGLSTLLEIDQKKPSQTPVDLNARIKNYIGWAYRQLEKYEESKKYYKQGIAFAEATGDSVLIGRLNNNISYAYLHSGDYEMAFNYQQKAKAIYEAAGEDYRLSFVLNGMFLVLTDQGLIKQAEKYIRQSLEIREEVGNPNLLDIAYHNMASNYSAQGKKDSAVIYFQKSLELSRMLENPFDITQTLQRIGDIYYNSGDLDNALLYYDEALEYNRQTNRPVSIADNLAKISEVAVLQEDFAAAESFLEEAVELLQGASSPVSLAEAYFDFANLKLEQGKPEDAQPYILQGLEIADSRGLTPLRIRGLSLYGKLLYQKNELNASLNKYLIAYELSASEHSTNKIEATINLALAYRKADHDSAFIIADKAFERIDKNRTGVAGLTFRAGFFRDHAKFYNEVASWYASERGNSKKAYELVEAAKSRVLMDEMAEAEEKLYEQLDESTLIRKQQMQKQIDRLYTQIKSTPEGSEKDVLRDKLRDLEFKYETFLNEMRQKVPEWKSFVYPKPLGAEEVMSLLDEETAIIEYAFTENKLTSFLIIKNEIISSVVDSISDKDAKTYLTEEIRKFRSFIIDGSEETNFERLSHTLIPEELSQNNAIQNILVIPDGVISFIPFEALKINNEYVIKRYNIKYLPSASIYPFIQEPHRTADYDLLALAGSGFEGAQGPAVESSSQRSFASLPSTLLEVDSIATNFENARILKNEDVTEATLKSFDLSQFRYLHFATHADIDEVNPSQSGLLLSKKMEVESLFGEDGHLNSTEISRLHLNADLVTLSACNTGMGKVITGEGLLGLQRSFLSAGASSVIVSLWSVFDRSTSVFMTTFYKSMLKYKSEDYGMWSQTMDWMGLYEHPMFDYKTKALREAKLAMIEHPYYSEPVHWAPFILIGK